MASKQFDADVLVIGGGFSGLACATALNKCNAKVLVLEARDRVGGRTCNENVTYSDGTQEKTVRVDVGGAYVGPTQDRLLRVARDVGIETYKVYQQGKRAIELTKGQVVHLAPGDPEAPNVFDLNNSFRVFDRLSQSVDKDKPWAHPQAKEMDEMSMQDWMNSEVCSTGAWNVWRIAIRALLCKDPADVSLLYMAWYVKSGSGLQCIVETENGAQERKFKEGSCTICERLHERLGIGLVRMNSPVQSIVQSAEGSGVHVTIRDGTSFLARYVVVALAPTLYHSLGFSPPLPTLKAQMALKCPMGSILKTNMYYKRAYWREKGFTGEVFCDYGPINGSFDDSGHDSDHPSIMGFVLAAHYYEMAALSKEERQKRIASQYARMLGIPEMLEPIAYVEKDWCAEEFSKGCYVASMPPSVLSTMGHVLREPVGRIHFAGTETASKWVGYMDGAIEAGERAARETLQLLSKDGVAVSDSEKWPSTEEEPVDKEVFLRPQKDMIVRWLPSFRGLISMIGVLLAMLISRFGAKKGRRLFVFIALVLPSLAVSRRRNKF